MAAQKAGGDHQVAVYENDHVATGCIHTPIAALSRTTVLLLDQSQVRQLQAVLPQPANGGIG